MNTVDINKPNKMHRVPHFTFRISRQSTFNEIITNVDRAIEHTLNHHVYEDIDIIKAFLHQWVIFTAKYDLTQPNEKWNDYFIEAAFPRFLVKASLNICA